MKLRFLFSFIFVCAFLLLPSIALGAVKLNLDYPSFGGFNLKDDQNISQLVAWTYYAMIGIAGLAAFVMLVWGGVQWLVSGAIPSQLSEAKDKVRAAGIGLLLVLSSFLIIQIINPELTNLNQPALKRFLGTVPAGSVQGDPQDIPTGSTGNFPTGTNVGLP